MEDLSKLSKELNHYDPHLRQNAVIGLGRYFKDEDTRKKLPDEEKLKIVNQLLTRLEPKETSMEVKGRTVKIFSQIAKFLHEAEIVQIFSKIINYLTNESSEGKDIYVICIQTIFKEAPDSSCYMIGKVIVPVLTMGIKSKNKEISQLCLTAFKDYINAFDNVLLKESESVISKKEEIIKTSVGYILSDDRTLQLNAINFIGTLSLILTKKQINLALDMILPLFAKTKNEAQKIAVFNTLESMAKASALKQIDYIAKILPLVIKYTTKEYIQNSSDDYDAKNQLCEAALNAIEIYILKLNNVLSDSMSTITENCLFLMEFDPNYSYENKEEEEVGGYDEYDDDYEVLGAMDDSSWVVRRAAVNVLHAMIKSGIALQRESKEKIIKKLVMCIREHDENTKSDIIHCLEGYLASLVIIENTQTESKLVRKNSFIDEFIPSITNDLMDAVMKHLKSTNQKIVVDIFNLLPVIALVASNEIIGSFDTLKTSLEEVAFSDNVKTIAFFKFLTQLFKANQIGENYVMIYQDIVNYIKRGISNDFYKISIEAVNAAYYLFSLLSQDLKENEDFIKELSEKILPLFKLNDIDQELKITLIKTVGEMIINSGTLFDEKKLNEIFKIYLDKTINENIRPHVLALLIKIIDENKGLKLNKPLAQYKTLIKDLLNKSSNQVYFQVLTLLEKIYSKYPDTFKGAESGFITEILEIPHEDNLIPLIYNVLSSMLNCLSPQLVNKVIEQISNKVTILESSGKEIDALFKCVKIYLTKMEMSKVKAILKKYNNISALNSNTSKFVAILAAFCKEDSTFIKTALGKIKSNKDNMKNCLILIGDICLYSNANHMDIIKQLESMLESADEETQTDIAIAIGKIGLGDPISFISQTMSKNPSKFTFISVREFLSQISESETSITEDELSKLYSWLSKTENLEQRENSEVCGECLGLLAGYKQTFITPYLKAFSGSKIQQSALFYGLKSIFSTKIQLPEKQLKILIEKLIEGLKDSELAVKEKAYESLTNAAHNYSDAVKERYDDLLKIFEADHLVNTKLIEKVDFGGGLIIKKDRGLGVRKALYTTTKIFIEMFPSKINIPSTIKMCSDALGDNEEIQSIVFGALIQLAHLFPSAFISFVELLCDQIKMTLDKIRSNESKVEFAENVRKLFKEMKREHEIVDQPKFVNLDEEIEKIK